MATLNIGQARVQARESISLREQVDKELQEARDKAQGAERDISVLLDTNTRLEQELLAANKKIGLLIKKAGAKKQPKDNTPNIIKNDEGKIVKEIHAEKPSED